MEEKLNLDESLSASSAASGQAKKDEGLDHGAVETEEEQAEGRLEAVKEKKSQKPTPEELEAVNEERWKGIRAVLRNPDFDTAVNNLASVFSQRGREGFFDIAPADTAQRLGGILREFDDLRTRATGRSEFGPAAMRLKVCAGEIGSSIRRDQVNDDPRSLLQVAAGMERLEEMCNTLAAKLRVAEQPESPGDDMAIQEAVVGLKKAAEELSINKRKVLAYRLDIDDYLSRRY